MSLTRYQRILRHCFYELLKRKTGWGRNEVMTTFDQANAFTLASLVDEAESPHPAHLGRSPDPTMEGGTPWQ